MSAMSIQVAKLREEYDGHHHLITKSDGQILFLRAWEPQTPIKDKIAILIFHDITAHSGAYDMLAVPLSKKGYFVFGLDLRGHGLSDGIRGDYPNKESFVNDLCETISFLKQQFPTVILLGHSLGSFSCLIASNHCLDNVNGLILLGIAKNARPGVYHQLSIFKRIKIWFSALFFPSRPVIPYYWEGMRGLNDPLFNFKYTRRFFNMFLVIIAEKLDIPILVGLGDKDELFSVESSQKLFDEIPSAKKEFMVFPDVKHVEFLEDSVTQIISWLNKNFRE